MQVIYIYSIHNNKVVQFWVSVRVYLLLSFLYVLFMLRLYELDCDIYILL